MEGMGETSSAMRVAVEALEEEEEEEEGGAGGRSEGWRRAAAQERRGASMAGALLGRSTARAVRPAVRQVKGSDSPRRGCVVVWEEEDGVWRWLGSERGRTVFFSHKQGQYP